MEFHNTMLTTPLSRRPFLKLAATGAAVLAAPNLVRAQEKLKIGFIYVGPIGDFGWSYQHDQGRLAIEKEYGDKVETTYVESVPESDAERAIEGLVRNGCKLIFTTSFGFMDATLKVAAKYPDVKFEHATGFKQADNVATYSAKFHEGRHVIGLIAGKMTKTNTIGYVAAFPIPEVIAGINAFYLAAKSVNPAVKVKVVWANTWFDPAKEADAAKALLDQGVDIMSQHTDSPAPLQAAAERGFFGFGQASDMARFAEKHILTSIIDNWSPYYIKRTGEVLAGTWKSGNSFSGMAVDEVVMGAFSNMPDDVKKLAEQAVADIKAGKQNGFACPIKKQDGSDVACEGGTMLSDGQIAGMNFFVEGIEDKIPG
jgi:basic membrane protein A and related proteins